MGDLLHVLLFENDEEDARLLIESLEAGGFAPDCLRVDSADTIYRALKEKKWDVILTDNSKIRFELKELLKLRDRIAPDTPVIVVADKMGNTTDSRLSDVTGVQDSVFRLDLTRLPIAVRRAVADIKVRQKHWEAEQKLTDNTRLNQILLDAFPHPIMLLRPGTYEIIALNKAAIESGAQVGAHCYAAWGRQEKPCPWCLASIVWQTGKAQHCEVNWVGRWWDAYWFPVDKDHYMHFIYDITERKENELRVKYLNSVIKLVRDVNELIVSQNDEITLLQSICERMVENTGYQFVWVGLKDHSGSIKPTAQGGKEINYARCLGVIHTQTPQIAEYQVHHDCVFNEYKSSISLPLSVEKETIGILNICSNHANAFEGEELELVRELAADLSLGIEKIRKRDELRLRNQYIEKVIENLPIGLAVNTISDGTARFMNRKFEENYGWPREELTDVQKFFERVYPDPPYREAIRERVLADIQSGDITRMHWDDVVITTSTGEQKVIAAANIPLPDQDLMISTVQDITARKAAEEEVKLRARLLDAVSDSVFLSEPGGKILYLNENAYKTRGFSRDELLGADLRILRPAGVLSDWEERRIAILQKGEASYDSWHCRKDGSKIQVEVHARAIDRNGETLILSVVRDITQRKRMESQMVMTDRLASVGELASGIAHEVNNPLTGIIGFAQMLLEKDLPDEVHEEIKIIHDEAERAANVLRNLLSFARKPAPYKSKINLNSTIEKVLRLRAYEQRLDNITTATSLAADLPEVYADNSQLQQCFLNIVINAEHFMKTAHGGGRLTVNTTQVSDMVRVTFHDDGPGIPQESIGHVFDPFFTTKEVGEGTGLGLSICHGLVKAHRGRIWAESTPGYGTAFIIELPIERVETDESELVLS